MQIKSPHLLATIGIGLYGLTLINKFEGKNPNCSEVIDDPFLCNGMSGFYFNGVILIIVAAAILFIYNNREAINFLLKK